MRRILGILLAAGTATAQTQNLSFVTCPVVRDTKTTPCWLAEYKGEMYYLGVQGGVAQDFYPPQLNHEVLVEGVVAEGPRICGGIPLQPIKTSVILELNRACNTILPAEDAIEPPGRAGGRGQGRGTPTNSWTRSEGPGDSTTFFDFDNDFLSLHSTRALQQIADNFRQSQATAIQVTSHRGASKLSTGSVMVENARVATERATKVRDILVGLGVPASAVKVQLINDAPQPDGINDPWSRKVVLSVKR